MVIWGVSQPQHEHPGAAAAKPLQKDTRQDGTCGQPTRLIYPHAPQPDNKRCPVDDDPGAHELVEIPIIHWALSLVGYDLSRLDNINTLILKSQ